MTDRPQAVTNRIAEYFTPNHPTKREAERAMQRDPEDEVSKALNEETIPVDSNQPLEMYFPRSLVIDVVENAIAALRKSLLHPGLHEEQRRFGEAGIRQRVTFLEQLRNSTEAHVYLAVYPPDAEDVLDSTEDPPVEGDDDLPGLFG